MTIPYGYDFADDLVRALVTDSHVPLEQVEITMSGTTIRPLVCEKCHATWPCTIITGLRDYYDTVDTSSQMATTIGVSVEDTRR